MDLLLCDILLRKRERERDEGSHPPHSCYLCTYMTKPERYGTYWYTGFKIRFFELFELLSSFYKLKPVWTFYSELWHQEDIFMRPISVNSRNGCEWKSWSISGFWKIISTVWKNGWEGAWRIIFTHELAPLSPDLKFIESLWDVLEETLQSDGLLHCQYKILTKNVCTSERK